jgi:hypothetical protein
MSFVSISNLNEDSTLLADLNDFELVGVGGGYCSQLDTNGGIYICQEPEESTAKICYQSETRQQSVCAPL